jgi:hypothetical protein
MQFLGADHPNTKMVKKSIEEVNKKIKNQL